MAKYDVVKMTKPKKTPVMKSPAGFPELANQEIHIMDATFNYPATAQEVTELWHQPRNKEVCKIIDKTIKEGYKVVIWPQNIQQKDINEMVLSGHNVKKIIRDNTYCGLEATIKFVAWKRI